MLRHERLNALLEMVAREGSVDIDDVGRRFGVSPATVRRDLNHLAAQQFLTRTRGGAVAHAVTYDLPLRYKRARHSEQKRRVARAVAALVGPGDVVGLNGGTTMTEVARALAERAEGSGASPLVDLTVVTNALNIAHELAVRPQIKVVVVGGVLRPESFELVGPFAQSVVDGISTDIMLLGVDSLDPVAGAAAADEQEAQINRAMVRRSRRVVVVADSSKLGARAFCTICPVSQVHELVTDPDADARLLERLEQRGVHVLLC